MAGKSGKPVFFQVYYNRAIKTRPNRRMCLCIMSVVMNYYTQGVLNSIETCTVIIRHNRPICQYLNFSLALFALLRFFARTVKLTRLYECYWFFYKSQTHTHTTHTQILRMMCGSRGVEVCIINRKNVWFTNATESHGELCVTALYIALLRLPVSPVPYAFFHCCCCSRIDDVLARAAGRRREFVVDHRGRTISIHTSAAAVTCRWRWIMHAAAAPPRLRATRLI